MSATCAIKHASGTTKGRDCSTRRSGKCGPGWRGGVDLEIESAEQAKKACRAARDYSTVPFRITIFQKHALSSTAVVPTLARVPDGRLQTRPQRRVNILKFTFDRV